ncbi:MAG: hypothetical protein V4695_10830 [Pseudomonadota bacterium]
MKTETASQVRKNLSMLLSNVFETGEDLGIDLSGQIVAILTSKKPERQIQPIRVKTDDAKKDWAELLQAISMRRARFFFARKLNEQPHRIYLLPNPDFENSFAKRWSEHVADYKTKNTNEQFSNCEMLKAQNDTAHQIASLRDDLLRLDKKIAQTFAIINRGDIRNTPEQGLGGLYDADDLDRY